MAKSIGMDMTTGPFFKKMLRLSLPILVTYILQLTFNFVDVIVLGILVDDKAVGAVGSTTALINLTLGLFNGVSLGANILTSKSIGEKNQEKTRRLVGLSIFISVIFGLFLVVVGLLFSRTFLEWMDSPEDLIDMSSIYLKIIFLGMPIKLLYNFSASILRASGETMKPMIFLCIGGVLNIGLNVFSILVLGLEIEGVAIATVVSEAFSAVLCLIVLIKNDGIVKLCAKYIRFYKKEFIEMVQQGVPSGIQSCLFALSNVVIQSSINSFGSIIVSGNTYAAQLETFVYHATFAFAVGTMTFISANYGAKNFDNIKKCIIYGLTASLIIGFVGSMILFLLRWQLLGLFTDNKSIIEAACFRLSIICPLYFACGFMDMFSHCLKGLGRSTISMIIALTGSCLLRIVGINIFLKIFNNVTIIYIIYVISWIITGIAQFITFMFIYKKLKKYGAEPESSQPENQLAV